MTTLTREKREALREAARVANSDTDYIPPARTALSKAQEDGE